MKKMLLGAVILAALSATGCRTIDRADQRAQTIISEREQTRRFAVCMKQSLGPFGAFAAPSARQQAAETCSKLVERRAD